MREFKVVILGPGGVGKSALTVQFISGKFVERYDPTVEDFYRKEIEVDGDPAILEILDTAGTEQFASMRDLYIKNGQGFIIVFSLTSRQSFQDIKLIREQILRVKGTNRVPIVLAANKSDVAESHREVLTEECTNLANEWNIPYMETSAKHSTIVNSLFTEVVKEMNFKLFTHSIKKSRKDKKKLKKLKNLSINSGSVNNNNNNNKTDTSSSNSNSFASSNANELEKMKLKKANYERSLAKCGLFHSCKSCFCIQDPSHKGYNTRSSDIDFYTASSDKNNNNKCAIL